MATVVISKAEPTIQSEPVEETSIHISEPMPKMLREGTLEQLAEWFDLQAYWIEKALFNSLPGGTYDHLLSKMLARKASHFVVSHKQE
jgi:hypothetical protein